MDIYLFSRFKQLWLLNFFFFKFIETQRFSYLQSKEAGVCKNQRFGSPTAGLASRVRIPLVALYRDDYASFWECDKRLVFLMCLNFKPCMDRLSVKTEVIIFQSGRELCTQDRQPKPILLAVKQPFLVVYINFSTIS